MSDIDQLHEQARHVAQGIAASGPSVAAMLRRHIARIEWGLLPWYIRLWKRLHGEQAP